MRRISKVISAVALAATMLGAPGIADVGAQDTKVGAATNGWTAPQRRRIILMRHGDVAYFDAQGKPVPDPDKVNLSDKGKAQADATGAYLKTIGIARFDRVLSSDLPRTVETAERVLAAAGIAGSPTQVEALREMRNGSIKDVATADLPTTLLALAAPRVAGDTRFIGRESVAELQGRIAPTMKALLDDKDWDTALLVLHALVNNAILSKALTGDTAYYGRFDQGAGCLAIIDVGADFTDAVVKAVNVCPNPSPYGSRLMTLEGVLVQALKGRQ